MPSGRPVRSEIKCEQSETKGSSSFADEERSRNMRQKTENKQLESISSHGQGKKEE